MTKRILSLLLIAAITITSLFFTACDKNSNSDNDSKENLETVDSTPSTTCHDGLGTCSICGLDYYDALVEYIKTAGSYDKETNDYILEYSLDGWDAPVYVKYSSKYERISVGGISERDYGYNEYNYYGVVSFSTAFIHIYKSKIKYGEYDWWMYGIDRNNNITNYDGTFQASKVSPDAPIDLSGEKNITDNKFDYGERDIQDIINNILPKFLANSGTNITMANLGFARFKN